MSAKEETVFRIKGNRSAVESLYLNDLYADVTFIIEEQRLPAHRIILAAQNEYFRGLLFGGLRESNESEVVLQVPVQAFKLILKFIYTNEVELPLPYKDSDDKLQCEPLIEILGLVNEYGIADMVKGIVQALTKRLSLDNALTLLKYAEAYGLMEELFTSCYDFLDGNATNLLQHNRFSELSKDSLISLLKRDSFSAPESQIFTAVLAWQRQNSSTDLESLWPFVRFNLLKTDFILETVKPLELFTPDKIIEMMANAHNIAVHTKNKRTMPTQSSLCHDELADPADCDRIYCAEKIVPLSENHLKLSIDLVEMCTFNYIRFDIDKSDAENTKNLFGDLDFYTTCDYVSWDICTQIRNCLPTLRHLSFKTCSAKCIRIDFINWKMPPLENFEILNVKKWQICNIATEAMGAELIHGTPINGHKLLATRPFDSAIQLNSVAYTVSQAPHADPYGNESRSIQIRFGRLWPICRIRARFLSKPTSLEIKSYNPQRGMLAYKPTLMKTTLDFEFPSNHSAYCMVLYGKDIECTHFECWAAPYEGYELETTDEGKLA